LAKVADGIAFAGLGPSADRSSVDRGRWIVARVRQRLLDLERAADGSPSGRAVRCWARYVDEGLSPVELHQAHPELIVNEVPARTDVARRNRVQSLMWAGGARGDKDSLQGVLLLGAELRTALSTDLPDGTRMDAITFGYEWDRLAMASPAGRDLLQVLARLAPDRPFPGALLREAGDCLPGLGEAVCASPAELRATCAVLRDRGLLELDGDHVVVREGIARHVVDRVPPERGVHWTAAVLRFLTHALRPDTHYSDSWPDWELGYPHVLAVCAAAERERIQLGDVAYLLDRASVYVRDGVEDADRATALAERAAALAVALGDAELSGDCLANLALAHRAANRVAEAVRVSAESIACVAEAFGIDNEAYAESLTVHANILATSGRTAEAGQAHARAVEILRKVYAKKPLDHVRALLVEALNDHAGHLLSAGESVGTGRELLEEANRLVRRGEYGWTQIELNLAKACRLVGDLLAARDYLETVRDHCVANGLNPSTTLVAALADLAEVYGELGDRRAVATLREAHRVDNALVAMLDRPLREGRSS
jgi:tetratricopeptide (TPR) repeat protein